MGRLYNPTAKSPPVGPPAETPMVNRPDPTVRVPLGDWTSAATSKVPASERKLEQVRLSLRIMRLLAVNGRASEDGHARIESTQQGMAESLGVTQGAISKVLSRLQAAGVILRERRRVQWLPRRVRAYYLTPRGEELARELYLWPEQADHSVRGPPLWIGD